MMGEIADRTAEVIYGKTRILSDLHDLPAPDLQGWGWHHPILGSIFDWTDVQVYLEVGVWKGMSAIRAAKQMQDRNIDGVVVAVDTWLGGEEHFRLPDMRREGGYPRLFQTFAANCIDQGVADLIVPVPVPSHIAALELLRKGVRADIIYIDASHEYSDVLQDLRDYWPLLKEGGYFIGDDYHGTSPGVMQAVQQFATEQGLRVFIWASKFMITRPEQGPLCPELHEVTGQPLVHQNGLIHRYIDKSFDPIVKEIVEEFESKRKILDDKVSELESELERYRTS